MANCLADVHDGLGDLARLPTEMLDNILDFMDMGGMERLARASKRLQTIVVRHAVRTFVQRTGFSVDPTDLVDQIRHLGIEPTVFNCMCVVEGLFYLNHDQGISACGVVLPEQGLWRKDDRQFRFSRHPISPIYSMSFRTADNATRTDYSSPSYISWYLSGQIRQMSYHKGETAHRDGDFPALIEYHDNGRYAKKVYMKNDNVHRDNGQPAVITWRPNGDVASREWWENGSLVSRVDY
jgi:hypothetical protein